MRQLRLVVAVLLVKGRYVLQLRDDKPNISAPNQWGLFGGKVANGESPHAAMVREVQEDIGICPRSFHHFGDFENLDPMRATVAYYSIYVGEISKQWPRHQLGEGQCAAHFAYEEIASLTMPPLARDIIHWHHSKNRLATARVKSYSRRAPLTAKPHPPSSH